MSSAAWHGVQVQKVSTTELKVKQAMAKGDISSFNSYAPAKLTLAVVGVSWPATQWCTVTFCPIQHSGAFSLSE
jgi:hypothetical protein